MTQYGNALWQRLCSPKDILSSEQYATLKVLTHHTREPYLMDVRHPCNYLLSEEDGDRDQQHSTLLQDTNNTLHYSLKDKESQVASHHPLETKTQHSATGKQGKGGDTTVVVDNVMDFKSPAGSLKKDSTLINGKTLMNTRIITSMCFQNSTASICPAVSGSDAADRRCAIT
ncbi:hypothetical protein E2C01_012113 [Portunus trituberculatus]|uniref:Uncharacterized protein n=1 Tax=Portunus trituberculatus TaxID=210409 RepID=A0A5B7DCM2_PORTR|nr:hypothetical protein [Portunus trituberculatus]